MAKLMATELAGQAAFAAMQLTGGHGYAAEKDMERHLRTAVVSTAVRAGSNGTASAGRTASDAGPATWEDPNGRT